jgi:hypothetical protein
MDSVEILGEGLDMRSSDFNSQLAARTLALRRSELIVSFMWANDRTPGQVGRRSSAIVRPHEGDYQLGTSQSQGSRGQLGVRILAEAVLQGRC